MSVLKNIVARKRRARRIQFREWINSSEDRYPRPSRKKLTWHQQQQEQYPRRRRQKSRGNLQKITFNMFVVNIHTTAESHTKEREEEEERCVCMCAGEYYRYIRERRATATQIYIYLEKETELESEANAIHTPFFLFLLLLKRWKREKYFISSLVLQEVSLLLLRFLAIFSLFLSFHCNESASSSLETERKS